MHSNLPPLAADAFTVTVENFQFAPAPLLPHFKGVHQGAAPQTDDCFLWHYRTSEILDLLCSAQLRSARSMSCRRLWPISFTWVHGEHSLTWNLAPCKPLQCRVVAKTDKLSFISRLYKAPPVWKRRLREALGFYSFDVLILSPPLACLILH